MREVDGPDIGMDPTLRPLTDVGTMSLTVKRKVSKVDTGSAAESRSAAPDGSGGYLTSASISEAPQEAPVQPQPLSRDDEHAERMRAAGWRIARGAWRR